MIGSGILSSSVQLPIELQGWCSPGYQGSLVDASPSLAAPGPALVYPVPSEAHLATIHPAYQPNRRSARQKDFEARSKRRQSLNQEVLKMSMKDSLF